MKAILSPLDALEQAFLFISGMWSNRLSTEPGAIIKKLSPEQREILSHLKSDDIGSESHVDRYIMASIGDENYQQKLFLKSLRDDKLSFDKRMKNG